MLGLDLSPRVLPATMGPVEGSFTGKVEISGALTGTVLLHGSRQLAGAAADVICSTVSQVVGQSRVVGMLCMN